MTFANQKQPMRARKGALRVVLIYAVFSCLWILFSDAAVGYLFHEREIITLVSTLKGSLFVAVTALLLYILVLGLINEASEYSEREQMARLETERTSSLLEAILESSSDAIFAKDLEGRYLLFSREAARVTGKYVMLVIGR